MPFRPFRSLLVAAALAALVGGPALAVTTLKMGSLAPKKSSWGKIFGHMAAELSERSGGELVLDIFDSGVQGDEKEMVEKMKTGQLQMAAITSIGIGKIDSEVLVFQLPGLFKTVQALDAARDALSPRIEASRSSAGATSGPTTSSRTPRS